MWSIGQRIFRRYAETRSFGFFDYLMKLVDITIMVGVNGKRFTMKKKNLVHFLI